MKLIVGLGNPGEKYKNNRHNVGYKAIDELKSHSSKLKIIKAVKTNCFMNESGNFVKKLINQYRIDPSDLWVIHDDLDIKLGDFKIQKGKGPREHGGLLSIEKELGTKDFWRVRVGIENRDKMSKVPSGEEYVLQDFNKDELEILEKTINNVVKELLTKVSLEKI